MFTDAVRRLRLCNGGRVEYLFTAVLFALSAVLSVLMGVPWEERPAPLPKTYQTLTPCGAVRLNAGQRWPGQRIRVHGEVDTLTFRDAGTAVISMVCDNEGAALIWAKLFDRTDLRKAEYLKLTAGRHDSGCRIAVTVEGRVDSAGHSRRVTLRDALIRDVWLSEVV